MEEGGERPIEVFREQCRDAGFTGSPCAMCELQAEEEAYASGPRRGPTEEFEEGKKKKHRAGSRSGKDSNGSQSFSERKGRKSFEE